MLQVPWPEMIERPGQPEEELLARWAALPPGRAFKSHSHPGANLQVLFDIQLRARVIPALCQS